ncbi:MAG TPA: electron transfer flavoprotein subunit alpha/FixB family protein [Streptosporangiaceae bacterium]
MTVLCLVEQDGDAVADASLRALTLARELAAGEGLAAAVFAPAIAVTGELAAQLTRFGAADGYAIELPGVGYAPAAWAAALAGLAASCGATAVLAAATDRGSEVLAHLGAVTGEPVAANCVSVRREGSGRYTLVRHRWAGSLLEDATLDAELAVLSVAADAVPARPVPAQPVPAQPELAVHPFRPEVGEADLRVRAVESAQRSGGVSLASARVVVGGGRGVGGADGFAPLEELAELLGGALGVSRVVTSQGWRPHRQQVGQTGTRISPELYLACGISGAVQHMAGCLGSQHIVAVNTDPDAPIIAHADYAVIGDLSQIIPALVTALKSRG